jgi:ornithine cyclodeaminase
VLEPRVHLAPPNGGAGHFNVLRGHLGPEHVSGVKVVGDFVGNWRLGLPSELALVCSSTRTPACHSASSTGPC